jgi:hypothetical protein
VGWFWVGLKLPVSSLKQQAESGHRKEKEVACAAAAASNIILDFGAVNFDTNGAGSFVCFFLWHDRYKYSTVGHMQQTSALSRSPS